MKKIAVLIPCLNEEAAIGEVLARFPRDKLASAGFTLDVIVIDNNSTDKTADVARSAGAIVCSEPRPGKGFALRTGFYNIPSDTDIVVMLDGDGTYRPEEILRLIEPIESGFAHAIIGSRMYGHMYSGSMRGVNWLGNRVYSRLVRTTYHVRVTDV